MYNNTEERKYKRIELERRKYKEIATPYIARFKVKLCEGQEKSSLDWNIVAVKNLSAGGIIFNYYNENIEIGTLLDLKIGFLKSIPAINCIGRVIRIEESQLNSMSRIATELTEIDEHERKMINTTVEAALRKKAKKRISIRKN
ncbi:MAG: PilZ domain-containing protein [Planctomycetota bacterium]